MLLITQANICMFVIVNKEDLVVSQRPVTENEGPTPDIFAIFKHIFAYWLAVSLYVDSLFYDPPLNFLPKPQCRRTETFL